MNFNYKKRFGQSLIEILIALAIGAILIGASAVGISFITRSTTANENLQIASSLGREQIEKLRGWSGADWQNIYSLEKESSNKYFLIPSSTSFIAIKGEEGLQSGDTDGLVARWGFDEATGSIAHDYSGNQNNGSITGDITWLSGTSCKISGCFSHGSNNSIIISDSETIDQISEWTVMAWIKRNGIGVEDPILEKADILGGDGNFYLKITNQNKLEGGVFDAGSLEIWQNCGITSSTIISGAWYHVAMTFDSSENTLACYVNGTLDSINNSATNNPVGTNSNLKIGCKEDCNGTKFSGMIDDVRIYNKAFSETEIDTFYRGKFFIRSFFVENICRSSDEANEIQPNCNEEGVGEYIDPSTRKVTTLVKWPLVQSFGQIQLINIFTRWKNEVFNQKNWAGGAGQEGPITIPNSQFSSSSRINFSSSGGIFAE